MTATTTNAEPIAAHFARIAPIVGAHLRHVRVAVVGAARAAAVVEHLAACGVGRWLWDAPCPALAAELRARHGAALDLQVHLLPPPGRPRTQRRRRPDLVIAAGAAPDLLGALGDALALGAPALLIAQPPHAPCRAATYLPGDDPTPLAAWVGASAHSDVVEPSPAPWAWRTAAPLLAGLARAILLRGTPVARADLEDLWRQGARLTTIGADSPLDIAWSPLAPAPPAPSVEHRSYTTPPDRRGVLLVAGLGSLGSVAADLLAGHVRGAVLADPDRVDATNPARQAYRVDDVGRAKAAALRERLAARGAVAVAVESALADEAEVASLVWRHGVTAAIVATGTAADFPIARELRSLGVPHVVGRCYPRARYWEAVLVDGARGPSLDEVRGRVVPGPAAPLTPEQRAAYSHAGALEAEPATLVESGWAAAWLARLAAQLLAPPGLRERWLLEVVGAGRTCLVGGVGVEQTVSGPAYAVAQPGQIHAWGLESLHEPQRHEGTTTRR